MNITRLFFKIVLVLLVALPVAAQEISLAGTWQIDNKETSLTSIIFGTTGSIVLVMDGETFGGKDFKHNGRPATLTYKTNFAVKPAHLDMIVTGTRNNRQTIARGLIMVITPKVIKIALNFSDSKRPTDFTQSNSGFFKKLDQ